MLNRGYPGFYTVLSEHWDALPGETYVSILEDAEKLH